MKNRAWILRLVKQKRYNETMYDTSMPMNQGRQLPMFTLRQIDLPQILSVMKVKMTGKNEQVSLPAPEDQSKMEANFEMQSIRVLGDKPVDAKSLEQKDFERVIAKAKSGKS